MILYHSLKLHGHMCTLLDSINRRLQTKIARVANSDLRTTIIALRTTNAAEPRSWPLFATTAGPDLRCVRFRVRGGVGWVCHGVCVCWFVCIRV